MDMEAKASGIRDIPRLISVMWVLLADYRALRRFVDGAKDHEAASRFVAHLDF